MNVHLYIGERNYSSWSLRPWLVLRWAGIAFAETRISLDQPGYGESKIAAVLAVSPTGKVPALHVDGVHIWDSLAISEWAHEHSVQGPLWPEAALLRARARAVTAEMHSGFAALRRDLTMNLHGRYVAEGLPAETQADIARIDQLWSGLREEFAADGPWLFGQRSIADAFYAPVASRFRTYAIALSPASQAYRDTVLADADFRHWEAQALAETAVPFSRARLDNLYPRADGSAA